VSRICRACDIAPVEAVVVAEENFHTGAGFEREFAGEIDVAAWHFDFDGVGLELAGRDIVFECAAADATVGAVVELAQECGGLGVEAAGAFVAVDMEAVVEQLR